MPIKRYPDTRKYISLVNKMPGDVAIISNELIVGIFKRTQRGLDKNNASFREYSAKYKESKSKEFGSSRPNLTREGTMLKSMISKRTKKGFKIYFANNDEDQNKKAFGNNRIRPFFGLDKEQKKIIIDFLKNKFKSV